jgi:uroporphyrinogen III methyltransferase/synthase
VSVGKVYLVGAGPGDPGLLTVRGRELLERAEVIVADHLVDPRTYAVAPLECEVIVRPARRSGPYGSQDEINRLLVERGLRGQMVVRLKGGDPFVFGRGGEEAEALVAAGVPFEVVPGVTAAVAAPAYAGIPVTHRGLSGVVAFATGHEAEDKPSAIDWDAVARGAGTLVLYMSVERLPDVVARLRAAGRRDDEPVAIIERGTWPGQRTLTATLGDVVEKAREMAIRPPALTIVGAVVGLKDKLSWFPEQRRPRLLVLSTREEPADANPSPVGISPVSISGVSISRVSISPVRYLDVDVIRVSPLTVVHRFAEVKTALSRLERYKTIAFASAHAVDALVGALLASGRDLRALAGIRLCAVGEATARHLESVHLRADLTASGGGAQLAGEIQAAQLDGPVLLPRAAGGRDELADGLRAAGYSVDALDAYDTIPDDGALSRAARMHREQPFDAVAFASPKGAAAFLAAAGGPPALARVLVGSIGETTRAALEAAGLRVDVQPERPSLQLLVEALASALAARGAAPALAVGEKIE